MPLLKFYLLLKSKMNRIWSSFLHFTRVHFMGTNWSYNYLHSFIIVLGVSISNLILYRTCVHSLNHTKKECQEFLSPAKNNGNPLEEEVQKYATFVAMVRAIVESIAPAFLSLFLGVWSDTHGRKPLVVWPLFGK